MINSTYEETMERLDLRIRAGYPIIYIVSHEEARVMDAVARIVNKIRLTDPNKMLWRWYNNIGLQDVTTMQTLNGNASDWMSVESLPLVPNTPINNTLNQHDALDQIHDATMANFPQLGNSLTVFFDLHPYLTKGDLTGTVRRLRNSAEGLRQYYSQQRPVQQSNTHEYKTIIIVAPSAANLSDELERDMLVLDFPLPETKELEKTLELRQSQFIPADVPDSEIKKVLGREKYAKETAEQYKKNYDTRLRELIAGAGRGLTLEDYKLGLNLFVTRKGGLQADAVEEMLHLKADVISNPALQYTPHVNISLGGLDQIKQWIQLRKGAVISPEIRAEYHLPAPKGALLFGVSGGGKSQLAKLIAKEFNLALLRLDIGALFGSYVGESEERTRNALQLAEVLAPVVLWIDELDKAFAGMGQQGDSGVSARVFGHFLTWLSEQESNVFVVATGNDFRQLLTAFPEFGRKGRFDEIFWVDLPDATARQEILKIYLQPLIDDNYLKISTDDLQNLQSDPTIKEDNLFEQFVFGLSQQPISGSMTGAEIEYAITSALYKKYGDEQDIGKRTEFTGIDVYEALKIACQRCMYGPQGSGLADLRALQQFAQGKKWLFV